MFNGSMGFDIDEKLEVLRKNKWLILIGLGIIIVIIMIFNSLKPNGNANYNSLEEEIINKAKIYVADNSLNFNVDNNAYLDLNTLGVDTTNTDCSVSSGVLVNRADDSYYYSPYLMCSNYSSADVGTETRFEHITLKGGAVVVIKEGQNFIDPGYSVDPNYEVIVKGSVGTIPGIYTLNYILTKDGVQVDSVKRDVIVGNYDDEQLTLANANANGSYPVITLRGESVMTVQMGKPFVDPGYTAYDKTDGKMDGKAEILGSVNTNKPGDYPLTYSLRNSLGFITKIKRTIIVVYNVNNNINISSSLNTSSYIDSDVGIKLNITGSNYSYTVLPNGTKAYGTNITYEVGNNSNYVFKIYDKDGNFKTEEIKVDNIDSSGPVGTCSAVVSVDKTEISVSATDSKSGVQGYAYSTGVSYSNYVTETNYTIPNSSTVAYVRVQDIAGNVSTLMCNVRASADALIIDGPSNVKVGQTITLTAKENNMVNNNVTWSIDGDSSIASISSSGVVTGLKAGTVKVKATTSLGKSTTKEISVNTTSSGGSGSYDPGANPNESVVYIGETITLTTSKVFGKDVSGSITWSSSDSSKASINSSGVVTGVAVGRVTITAKASTGETATHTVNVIKSSCGNSAVVLGASVDGTHISDRGSFSMKLGETKQLKVIIPSTCGTPKTVARTDGSGSSNRDSIIQRSFIPHKVDRYDRSTWFAGTGFSVSIKAIGRGTTQYNLTVYYYTTDGLGFKSFYHVTVNVT